MTRQIIRDSVELSGGVKVAAIHAEGGREPIVFLHGFGCGKEDYADIVRYPSFDGHPFLAYDAPGFGETTCDDLSAISISFHVETVEAVLAHYGIERFHIAGHSMGGLTALLYAHRHPGRVLSFVNIEGNLAPEDCFLSRQILNHRAGDFLDGLVERLWREPFFSYPMYASNLRHRVREEAVRGVFTSIVELSDNGGLLSKFLALPCPAMFMYGAQNGGLSYLGQLKENEVTTAGIPHSGHFPMYANPPAMWQAIATFIGGGR